MLIKGEYFAWGWIEGETPIDGARRPRIEGEFAYNISKDLATVST